MTRLTLTRRASNAQATQGQPTAILHDAVTGKRYRYTGVNRDTLGGALGYWLQDNYHHLLGALARRSWYNLPHGNQRLLRNDRPDCLHGMTAHYQRRHFTHVSLDGSHGTAGMLRVAEAIGLQLTPFRNSRGFTTGFHVTHTSKEQS